MDLRHDELYCDRTWFDALGARCAQQIGRCIPQNRAEIWTHAFALFAALCVAWAAGLATQCMLFDLPANQCLAQLVAAGLLLAAARHFLVATGTSARGALPRRTSMARDRRRTLCESTQPSAASRIAASGRPNGMPAERSMVESDARLFFEAVKAAGINVRIARTLYAAGFRSAAQVRACEDARLLAINGIGKATLRKLRVQFGFSDTGSARHSSAA
ncbi:MAG: helix-hairpin-helix domain-containing protein [Thiohalobacteraceae bacterium]